MQTCSEGADLHAMSKPSYFLRKKKVSIYHLLSVSRMWKSLVIKMLDYDCSVQFPPASVAQLDAPSDWRPGGRGFNPRRGRHYSFVEIDREIFSTVILSLPLIQEGQL